MPDPPTPKHRPHPARSAPLHHVGERSGEGIDRTNTAHDAGNVSHGRGVHPHPNPRPPGRGSRDHARYAELHVTTNFTFLTGASHPDEYVTRAAELGLHAVAITDVNTLSGVVRAHVAAQRVGIPLVVGCRLVLANPIAAQRADMPPLSVLVYPTDLASYGRLCRLLTLGKRRAAKGRCDLRLHDLLDHHPGLLAAVIPPPTLDDDFLDVMRGLRRVFDDDRLSLVASRSHSQRDRDRLAQLAAAASHLRVPMLATNDVHHHTPQRKPLHDIVTCIRHGCTIAQAGLRIQPNAERHLKAPDEMARLFAEYPDAIARSVDLADRAAGFTLDQLRYQYPDEVVPPGRTPIAHLTDLTRTHAAHRYPQGVPDKVQRLIDHELQLIDELNYAHYFLTVYDIVEFARSRGILCQGRGAAANSAVCYVLGVTAVDPVRVDMLFERFVSRERDEPPDIDIDFEHERREEVIQYIYAKYGRDRAALTAEVITYRGRLAVREVGKALGLSLDAVDRLAKNLDWWDTDVRADRVRQLGFNPDAPIIRHLVALATELQGFPRHLSQHVGGFVITQRPLCELVPIENAAMPDRTVIEWDKDDIDAMGMLKVDCLGLGMLSCIRKALDMINAKRDLGFGISDFGLSREHVAGNINGLPSNPKSQIPNPKFETLRLDNIPPEDPAVYDMICDADTIGVFQIESRAQMSMLPRLRPRNYYDLVIEVAIVRPGPIQGQMVHPYLRRRRGDEPVTYPDERVRGVLERTLGVPLFQEQVMSLAVVAAGFTPGEADQLRRAIAAWKSRGQNRILEFERRFIGGMLARGYKRDFADRLFRQIQGFGDYGFPESHAASFALLVYVSAWLKRHHPAAFAAALINSQPMGFYAPAQIVRDAKAHGVEVRGVDVNRSAWDCMLEISDCGLRIADVPGATANATLSARDKSAIRNPKSEIRLGMRMVRGLREPDARAIADAVQRHGPFTSVVALWRASGVRASALKRLAAADAFASMGLDRQAALWEVRALHDEDLPLFDQINEPTAPPTEDEPTVQLPAIPEPRKVVQDYRHVGLSLRAHPLSFLRDQLNRRGVTPAADLLDAQRHPTDTRVAVAGLVLCRQRPGTASGVIFMTLEDETGVANLIVRPHVYEAHRRAARHGVVIVAHGKVERDGQVVHLLAERFDDLSDRFQQLLVKPREFR
ncbi:MAG: DNA polymerase III subunit alpha [Phycisphaera sp.]|nr:DNA polymerase III subunit alpha [Phycisphaera sp.]